MKNILHKFKNVNTGSYIIIKRELQGFMLVQENQNGTKQHLKLDDNGLTKFLNNTNNSCWVELPV